MLQLQDIYLNKSTQKSLDYVAISQMFPERICANAYMQKMSLINGLKPFYNAAMSDSYSKILKDFLILTCAQSQDSKNPTIIKDIKSLKIVYPSGQGCAIDMKEMILCVISILK